MDVECKTAFASKPAPTFDRIPIAASLITRIPREPAYVGRSATPASRAVCHSHRRRPPPASP
ncbi:hypothetical protein DBR46_05505 [Pseudomonas sp. KBW05]|nr:hypothetical protein DBR46_05505 [Pseudomonas sp. KBW05]